MRKTEKSTEIYLEAIDYLVAGVNSPVRAFLSVKTPPVIVKKVEGAYLIDVDNNRYIDYCSSWGANIIGHSNKIIKRAIKKAVNKGLNFGFTHNRELEISKLIIKAIPSIKKIRFVSSGTEAVMSAIRIARAYTNRDLIVKFDGCYHGHSDNMLVKAGSGVLTYATSSSKGVPLSIAEKTISIPFNDKKKVVEVFEKYKNKIAGIIVEPIPANMGVILPEEGFLKLLRDITRENKSLLIFDEVITGFRFSFGGVQTLFDIEPDLTCLGKIIGGGLPVAAFGGKNEIMELLAPIGEVYQAGTLSGNPIAMEAGYAILTYLKNNQCIYKELKEKTEYLVNNIKGNGIIINSYGSIWTMFFSKNSVRNYNDAQNCDAERFTKFYGYLLDNGILFPPSQFEACFITKAHSKNNIDRTVEVINNWFKLS